MGGLWGTYGRPVRPQGGGVCGAFRWVCAVWFGGVFVLSRQRILDDGGWIGKAMPDGWTLGNLWAPCPPSRGWCLWWLVRWGREGVWFVGLLVICLELSLIFQQIQSYFKVLIRVYVFKHWRLDLHLTQGHQLKLL